MSPNTEQETLEQRAAELREITNAPTERDLAARELIEVEARLAEQRKQQEQVDAEAQMLGIKQAVGSLRTEYAKDQERVRRAANDGWDGWDGKPVSLNAARQTMNERFVRLEALASEARGLNKTHGVPLPAFASLKSLDRAQRPAQLLVNVTLTPLLDAPDYARIMRGIAEKATSEPVEPQVPTHARR